MYLRSALLNVSFYVLLFLFIILASPTLFMGRKTMHAAIKVFNRALFMLMDKTCGIRIEVSGRENIPKGPALVASKHQSIIDNFIIWSLFDDPIFILKKELMLIPIFGWWLRRLGMIPIDRRGGIKLRQMNRRASEALRGGRQVLIFPEGTRTAVGEHRGFKRGVALLYGQCSAPCVPIVHNAGEVWPRRQFLKTTGTIKLNILPVIEPGLPPKDFLRLLGPILQRSL
jgi:1-acyl-sn-glycerol-3-phosphate acyltransferase